MVLLETAVKETAEEVFPRATRPPRVTADDPHSTSTTWCAMLETRDVLLMDTPGRKADLGTYYLVQWQMTAEVRARMRPLRVLNYQGMLWTEREVLHMCFRMWRPAAKYARADEEKRAAATEKHRRGRTTPRSIRSMPPRYAYCFRRWH